MRGVILAGGNGTRLKELSGGGNKHLVEVAGKKMLDYPIETLRGMDIDKVTIVTNAIGALAMMEHVELNYADMQFEFRLQRHPKGMAHALGCSAVKDEVFVVLCGDTYHDPAPKLDGGPQLWWTRQDGMNQGAIWYPLENRIIEKPTLDLGHPVTGMRVYDQRAMEMIKHLKPSDRGELELVDIDNFYLENGVQMSRFDGFFGDMGTIDGLQRVEKHIKENS